MTPKLISVYVYPDHIDKFIEELKNAGIGHSEPQRPSQVALNAGIDAETIKLALELVLIGANSLLTVLEIIKIIRGTDEKKNVVYKILDENQNEIAPVEEK